MVGLRARRLGAEVLNLGFGILGFGSNAYGFGFKVSGSGPKVLALSYKAVCLLVVTRASECLSRFGSPPLGPDGVLPCKNKSRNPSTFAVGVC